MRLWVAGQWKAKVDDNTAWELLGVYDAEELADAACTEWEDFFFPIDLNATAPHETVYPISFQYPRAHIPIEVTKDAT